MNEDDDLSYEQSLFYPPEGEPRADPAPMLLGNEGLKELLLAAMCVFDPNYQKQTAIPILVIAQSGGGKSTFFEGLKETFDDMANIYNVDAITPAQAKGTVRGQGKHKRVIQARLPSISLFDELNKWQINYLEGVLVPIFGAEQGVRVREGETFNTSDWRTLPIGTLLPFWQDFEQKGNYLANKKVHDIEQIMRRSLLFRLDDFEDSGEFLEDYIDRTGHKLFGNIEYVKKVDYEANTDRVFDVIKNAHNLGRPKFNTQKQFNEAKARLKELAPRILISERVVYDRAFIYNVLKLSVGLARRYNRSTVTLDDVGRIMTILEMHADRLGKLRDRCVKCHSILDQGAVKCRCGHKVGDPFIEEPKKPKC